MKSSATCQKVCLFAALASLNNGHILDLRAYYAGVMSLSRPSLVPAKPLHLRKYDLAVFTCRELEQHCPRVRACH
jgi:hypothetical protein